MILANIFLAAIVFTVIVGLLAWTIQTSRQPEPAARIKRSPAWARQPQSRVAMLDALEA